MLRIVYWQSLQSHFATLAIFAVGFQQRLGQVQVNPVSRYGIPSLAPFAGYRFQSHDDATGQMRRDEEIFRQRLPQMFQFG